MKKKIFEKKKQKKNTLQLRLLFSFSVVRTDHIQNHFSNLISIQRLVFKFKANGFVLYFQLWFFNAIKIFVFQCLFGCRTLFHVKLQQSQHQINGSSNFFFIFNVLSAFISVRRKSRENFLNGTRFNRFFFLTITLSLLDLQSFEFLPMLGCLIC